MILTPRDHRALESIPLLFNALLTESIETDFKRPELRALTGSRFVAALAVLLFHNVRFESGPQWSNRLISHVGKSVLIFFVLSGFILTYTYLDDARRKRFNLRSFFLARVARIYPVYLLGLVIALPFFAASRSRVAI